MEFKVYQASFVLNEFHRQATDVIDPFLWKTVSGDFIHITDALASPIKELSVEINSATGLTDCMVNVDGANLFDDSNYLPSMQITSSNKIGSHNSYNLYFAKCKKNTTYTFARNTATGYPMFGLCDEYPSVGISVYNVVNMRYIAKTTFNTGEHSYILYAKYKYDTGGMSLAVGGTAISADTPYTGTTRTISWQTEAGSITSGTLTISENGSVTLESGGNTYNLTSITPIETLEGENNVWCDGGSVELTYKAPA